MRRKKLAKLLFGLKVLAICGAAVFMIKGIGKLYADAGSDASKEEEIGEVQVTEESATTEPETVVMPEIEENAIAESQSVEEVIEYQGDIPSMDWDTEDAYLLEKIAMAEAEGEGVGAERGCGPASGCSFEQYKQDGEHGAENAAA